MKLKVEGEMEEFSILALDGDEAFCDLKILLANVAKRRQGGKTEGKSSSKRTSNGKSPTRDGASPGKTEPRERDSNGKDEFGIGNVEAE